MMLAQTPVRIGLDLMSLGLFEPPCVREQTQSIQFNTQIWREVVLDSIKHINTYEMPVTKQSKFEAEMRDPYWHQHACLQNDDVILHWHHDNDPGSGEDLRRLFAEDQWLVTWASNVNTEILMHDGRAFRGSPCEMIAFRNGTYKHRTPKMTQDQIDNRWFARAYLDPVPRKGYKIVPGSFGMSTYAPVTDDYLVAQMIEIDRIARLKRNAVVVGWVDIERPSRF